MKFIVFILFILFVQTFATHEKALACAGCLLTATAGCLVKCGPPVPTPVWVACEATCLAAGAAGPCRHLCGGG